MPKSSKCWKKHAMCTYLPTVRRSDGGGTVCMSHNHPRDTSKSSAREPRCALALPQLETHLFPRQQARRARTPDVPGEECPPLGWRWLFPRQRGSRPWFMRADFLTRAAWTPLLRIAAGLTRDLAKVFLLQELTSGENPTIVVAADAWKSSLTMVCREGR